MANVLYSGLFQALATRDGALMQLAQGAELSARAFHDMIGQAANALRVAGVQPGDRVAVQVAKSPQALAVYAAAVSIGAVFLPLNTAYTA
ncbi:MAG: AMP-binding protein, partial [Rhodobacteraceae bacterium]|nr:AMP-binding protein [Paracoccaceae bacterium]